jgi:hypothetical protein
MVTYVKITDYATKDALLTGNPIKVVRGTELGAEFDSIATADATSLKSGAAASVSSITDSGDLTFTGTGSLIQAPTNPMLFTVNGSERMRIDTSGNVGVGVLASSVSTQFSVGNSTDAVQLFAAAAVSTLRLGDWTAAGGASAKWTYDRATGVTAFYNGTRDTPVERIRIDTSGNVLVTNSGGLGYGTGSGGTVTQATSKSTAVTLNKPTGRITMNSAALAGGGIVFFTLNNSLISIGDILVTNVIGNAGNYRVRVECGNSVGATLIFVDNTTGGSLSDAIGIQFAILKGAIA